MGACVCESVRVHVYFTDVCISKVYCFLLKLPIFLTGLKTELLEFNFPAV